MGVSQIREKLDMLSASEFRSYTKADGTKLLDLGASTDWQDEIYRTGITQSHKLSFGVVTINLLSRHLLVISTRKVLLIKPDRRK